MPRRLRRPASSAAFLKPGALALLRDTRIRYLVRSLPSIASTPLSPPRSAASGTPSFSPRKVCGVRFLQRKKLVAAKFVNFVSDGVDVESDV